jgi:amylosucrase/maltose alpha-D-glucosyltransferase/alpha-amylase
MALLWDALATRDVRILMHAMRRRFAIPNGCAWINYIRCHDDIGWVFSNEDIEAIGLDAKQHRHFLKQFYTGRFAGSFARGVLFQENPLTGDARISGTCASLAGLEMALRDDDQNEIDQAIRRILLLHGITMLIGGIPLIYLGDEIGMLNDYGYDKDPAKIGDSRWLHRSRFDWQGAEQRHDTSTVAGRIYKGLLRLIQLRQQNLAFTRAETEFTDTGDPHVFGFFRNHDQHSVLVLGNFSEQERRLDARRLRHMGMRKTMVDIYAGRTITAMQELIMEPYQLMVLTRAV